MRVYVFPYTEHVIYRRLASTSASIVQLSQLERNASKVSCSRKKALTQYSAWLGFKLNIGVKSQHTKWYRLNAASIMQNFKLMFNAFYYSKFFFLLFL